MSDRMPGLGVGGSVARAGSLPGMGYGACRQTFPRLQPSATDTRRNWLVYHQRCREPMEGKLAHREILNTLPRAKWFLPLFRAGMWSTCLQKKRKTRKNEVVALGQRGRLFRNPPRHKKCLRGTLKS